MNRTKSPEREALTIAAELMADMGCCIHDSGYQCHKDIPLLLILTTAAGVLTLWKEIKTARAVTSNTDGEVWK